VQSACTAGTMSERGRPPRQARNRLAMNQTGHVRLSPSIAIEKGGTTNGETHETDVPAGGSRTG
jgi:hypothetical protein